MLTTLAERLKEAMTGPPKVTGVALARACGVKGSSVSDWLSGKSKTMEAGNLIAAAKKLNVDHEWLESGIGVKRPYKMWTNMVRESTDVAPEDPHFVEATRLLQQLAPEQWPESVSFLRWQLANKPTPSNGQALLLAG